MAAHSVFTIVASIVPGAVDELEKALAVLQASIERPPVPAQGFHFRNLKQLHFASFVIFDRNSEDPLLVFENNIDGPISEYLLALLKNGEQVIDAIYSKCVGYRAGAMPAQKLDYLQSRVRKPHLYHVGTAYRTRGSIKNDSELRSDLNQRLDALPPAQRGNSAAGLWKQLQGATKVESHHEPWLFEWFTDLGLAVVLPVVVTASLIWLFWDRHWEWYLIGSLAVIYAAKAAWLLTLVGWWPFSFDLRRGGFILLAAVFGASFGFWPWHPRIGDLVAGLTLVPVAATMVARRVLTRNVRQTTGNWLFVPIALLSAACTVFPVLAMEAIGRRFVPGAPTWLGWVGTLVTMIVVFLLAFVRLTFVSAMPSPTRLLVKPKYDLFLKIGGVLAFVFWVFAIIPPVRPVAAIPLAMLLLGGLIGLWDVPLPSPDIHSMPLDRLKLKMIEATEDKDVQNHMAVMVQIRQPRRLRAFLLRLFLTLLNRLFYRVWLPTKEKSTLFGIPTVHFAQWTVLDETRYMFLSNYDLSWGIYLDDFGAKLGQGLQKLWGQSEHNPGATDIRKFKRFVRTVMVPHQVWYRAYPDLTSEQIANNEKIRLGLLKTDLDEEKSATLLRRLARVEPSR